jgi:hypothetical protein
MSLRGATDTHNDVMGGVRVTQEATQPVDVTTLDPQWIAAEVARRLMPELAKLHRCTEERLQAIERKAAFTQEVSRAMWFDAAGGQTTPQRLPLTTNTPRPPAIDDACAADPSAGKQPVPLLEYGLTIIVTPGDDPEQVWKGILNEIAEQ